MDKSGPASPAEVAYPSRKKPVHPAKLATRDAVRRLRDAGLEPSQSRRGYPALFGMAKNDPELLQAVIQAILNSTENQKKLWKHALSNVYSPLSAGAAQEMFSYYSTIIPVAARSMGPRSWPGTALREVNRIYRELCDVHPDVRKNFGSLYEATKLYEGITPPPTHYGSMQRKQQRIVTAENIDDIVFIAEHYKEVQRILPELKKRKTRDRDMIAALLEIESAPLLDGAL